MKRKILLIEDNPDILETTADILRLAQFDVITAKNGKIGVELAMQHKPDLIICDIMMPVLDGYGVIHLLAKNESTAAIPFIFLTAKAERSDHRKGMEMGADDYLTKPFDDIELLRAIESRFKKSDLLKREFTRDVEGLNELIQDIKKTASLEELSLAGEPRLYKKKGEIYHEGSYPKGVYFINKGLVKTFSTSDAGKELITRVYKAGEFFGYFTLLQNQKYTDSASALEDSEIYTIGASEFFSIIHSDPRVSTRFIEFLSNHIADQERQLVSMAYSSVRKKVADAIIKLSDKFPRDEKEHIVLKISREDLANYAGTAVETLIRTLGDFKDEKYIEIAAGSITIINFDKLVQMKN